MVNQPPTAPFLFATMQTHRPLTSLLLLLLILPVSGADQAEREALRFNDAITKLSSARDEAIANHRAKAILALVAIAKSRTRAEDAAGASEAWRAILTLDRDHSDARAHFTAQGTLDSVLAELDAKPTDLLGLDSGDASAKSDKSDKGTVEKEKKP